MPGRIIKLSDRNGCHDGRLSHTPYSDAAALAARARKIDARRGRVRVDAPLADPFADVAACRHPHAMIAGEDRPGVASAARPQPRGRSGAARRARGAGGPLIAREQAHR
jgi:hypothetical protein